MKKVLINTTKVGISLALVSYLVWDAMNRSESALCVLALEGGN